MNPKIVQKNVPRSNQPIQSIHLFLGSRLISISVQLVHLGLLLVVVAEDEPEDDSREGRGDADARVHPHDSRVAGGRDEGFADGGADGGREEVEGLHEGLHARRGFGVSVFETGDWEGFVLVLERLDGVACLVFREGKRKLTRDENLGQTNEDVGGRLDGDVDVVGQRAGTVHSRRAASGVAVAGAGTVDNVLDDSGVGEADCSEEESDGDAGNGLELDLHLAKNGVDHLIQDGNEDNNRDG